MKEKENSVVMRVAYSDGKPAVEGRITKLGASATAIAFSKESCEYACREHEKHLLKQSVYVLWRPGFGEKPRAYIGISDNARQRMDQHLRKKDFWTRALVYTDGDNLRGDAEYVEARLVEIAKQAQDVGMCVLENTNTPRLRSYDDPSEQNLAERHVRDLRSFFLPLAGCYFLNPALLDTETVSPLAKKTKVPPVADAPLADIRVKADSLFKSMGELSTQSPQKGVNATGRETETGFVVCKGSTAALKATKSAYGPKHRYIVEKREELRSQGVLVEKDGVYRFSRDYLFNSSSIAASVVWGSSVNGRDKWMDNVTGLSLKELQKR